MINKIFATLFLLFLVSFLNIDNCLAAGNVQYLEPQDPQWGLNLYLPGLQFRFQDGDNQTRSLKTGFSLSGAIEFQNIFRVGLEYNMLPAESSGNSSLLVESKYTEMNVAVGYNVWRWDLQGPSQKDPAINYFSIWGVGYVGQGQTTVNTTLLGGTTEDTSSAELVAGLGVIGQYRYKFFLAEIDTCLMASKLYEPQTISVTSLRFGLQLGW